MSESYWESIRVDPHNYCPERGAYPHTACDVTVYEGNHGGDESVVYGGCAGHRTYWPKCAGGPPWEDFPSLGEIEEDYEYIKDPPEVVTPEEQAEVDRWEAWRKFPIERVVDGCPVF